MEWIGVILLIGIIYLILVVIAAVFYAIGFVAKTAWIFSVQNKYALIATVFLLIGIFFFRVYQTTPSSKPKSKRKKIMPPKEPETVKMVKGLNDEYVSTEHLQPTDGLGDIDEFAEQAVRFKDNPKRYSDFLVGRWHTAGIKRASKALDAYTEYLNKLREACNTAAQLQGEIIKNKYLHDYLAMIEIIRAKDAWSLEQKANRIALMYMDVLEEEAIFFKRFWKEIDIKDLSEDERILLFSQQAIHKQEMRKFMSFGSMGGISSESSSTTQNVNPVDLMTAQKNIDEHIRLLDVFYRHKNAEIDGLKAKTDIDREKAKQESIRADGMKKTQEHSAKEMDDDK